MGNNGSSGRDRQAASVCSNGLPMPEGTNRGWSQSFPRELTRHRSQACAARKVLPEPPNQRLRATDNGSIIHNGGTISGRKAPASRDLAKRDAPPYRERSGSASNLVHPRSNRIDRHHRADTIANLKKFDSEPDLRSSPDLARSSLANPSNTAVDREEIRPSSSSCHRYGRESKERLESRYKARKKYKAPAPPATELPVAGERANDTPPPAESRASQDRFEQPHHRHQLQPPPRRSRLFKTRAESKRAQVSWQLSSLNGDGEPPNRWNNCALRSRTEQHSDNEIAASGWQDRDLVRRPKLSGNAKNTLQRSMSSPEFQAELIRVARRVRDKLHSAEEQERFDAETAAASGDRERCAIDWSPVERPTAFHARTDTNGGGNYETDGRANRDATSKARSTKDNTVQLARDCSSPDRRQLEKRRDSDCNKWTSRKWPDITFVETSEAHSTFDKGSGRDQDRSTAQSARKTFYFGMNGCPDGETCIDEHEHVGKELEGNCNVQEDRDERKASMHTTDDTDDNERSVVESISLKLRPTLPKKQLEIPRFSPSAAWRLLSALEAPGPSMSTASEEMPVMFEERIERLSRPPPPFPLSLGPRSWHDKSGDSGISGDAGAPNEDSLDVSTSNRIKRTATRPTWTPQQDLGEESSSDAGVDSPSPLPTPFKYHSPRAHVFSLSLPRDDRDARTYLCSSDSKTREVSAFNSLQKLKRSVSGAFGVGSHDRQRSCTRDLLDDNWLLSTSAPTSLQHNHARIESTRISPPVWKPFSHQHPTGSPAEDYHRPNHHHHRNHLRNDDNHHQDDNGVDDSLAEDEDEEGQKIRANDFPVIMKPPSFSYLTAGGHLMYLPETSEPEHLRGSRISPVRSNRYDDPDADEDDEDAESVQRRRRGNSKTQAAGNDSRERDIFRNCSESRGNVDQRKETSSSPSSPLNSIDDRSAPPSSDSKGATRSQRKSNSKGKRFTFQSTVRQIERRRLAEKLSREAEAKERERKGELEAMRKVEEEFQRKRAKEKANIRQRLRLFKEMEEKENFNGLASADWDGSQFSRADPDGAPSSTASSPTSLPVANLPTTRKSFVADEFPRGRDTDLDTAKQARVQRQGYRPDYYDWSPETSSHSDHRQTTVHPKIVCDIPKSSPVFVHLNAPHPGKPATSNSTCKSDNYRKDFAHGTVATRASFASSDSELSLPNTRPRSSQTAATDSETHRARSDSPRRSEDAAASSEEDSPLSLESTTKRTNSSTHDFILTGVQPFTKRKAYRPISFNPPPIPS